MYLYPYKVLQIQHIKFKWKLFNRFIQSGWIGLCSVSISHGEITELHESLTVHQSTHRFIHDSLYPWEQINSLDIPQLNLSRTT